MIVNVNGLVVQLHGIQPSLPEFSMVEVLLIADTDTSQPKPVIPN
jgi:hypothetical protein